MDRHLFIITDVENARKEYPELSSSAKDRCFYCTKCNTHFNVPTPIEVDIVYNLGKEFEATHKSCGKIR